jgi:membrane protease YdiL (CAAX protease family)
MAGIHVLESKHEPKPAPQVGEDKRTRRVRTETLALLVVTTGFAASGNLYPSIGALPGALALVGPVIYVLVERKARHRSWAELGVRFNGFKAGVRSNWRLFLLVILLLQLASVFLARILWPSELTHISGRIPSFENLPALVPLIVVLTLREELVFRGLFQERISWFFGQIASVAGVSVCFALTHIAPGAAAVVAVDVLFVFFDGLVYGTIYSRSRNILVSWAAHAGADLVGLALLVWAASGT